MNRDSELVIVIEEYAMFRAYVSSLRPADLSRQIGVVVTRNNEILAEGVNDCPKAFGGLFSCHNCAKHIIAAGIEKVIYIEPYPKSKALDFYKIEISQDRKGRRV